MSPLSRARDVLDVEIEALVRTREALGAPFETAIRCLLDCLERQAKIVVAGVGKNLYIAEKIAATLSSTGATSVVLNPSQALHGDLGLIRPGDALIALSFSGESEELLTCAPLIRRMHVPIITMTGSAESSLALCSDIVIPVVVPREACPFNLAPTASTTATLAMGDALAMVLLDVRGFQREDYARLHPAGAIGKTLLCRVCDIMRRDTRVATVKPANKLRDALVAMTRARSGSACIVDDDGHLLGIFTDGDLRRRLTATDSGSLNQPVRESMSRNPVTVAPELPAVEALQIFENHRIDDLPVVDDSGRLVGCIDIQDLPRFKIV